MAREFSIRAGRKNAPFASLLALGAGGFSVTKTLKWAANEDADVEFNLDGVVLKNDATIARLAALASTQSTDFIGKNAIERAQVDYFVVLVERANDGDLKPEEVFAEASQVRAAGSLFPARVTLADVAVWSLAIRDAKSLEAFSTLHKAILADPRFAEALATTGKFQSTAKAPTKSASAAPKEKMKDEGKFVELPGAEKGKVVVRFPPEASGYLHIGHAKAALLNQYYQQAFEGQLIMRFDDTNPAKENAHFEQVIKEDLAMLNIVPDRWTHSSDHFDKLLGYCEQLLREGKAYVDDTDAETMRKEREERKESKRRNTTPEDNLALWEEMKKGTERGQQCAVRIKIDMNSNNGALRDPTIYRCKNEPHVRTGDKYKVYPTYDFACPIVDSIEGVTHALRTTEYHDRDDQYYFICDALGLRRPYIWEYARLNMTNTVMSKRKLTWFVDEHIVDGWEDPRFPTVRGVMRRGMTVEGLKQFIVAQGGSRSVVMMEWDKIWAFNKKVIDPIAPRYTALEDTQALVPVIIEPGFTDEFVSVPLHPKNGDVGEKSIHRSAHVHLEAVDAAEIKPGDTVTFINWGNLKIKDVKKNGSTVTAIHAQLDLDNKDFKKTLKVTWLGEKAGKLEGIPVKAIDYDHIISKAAIGKEEDWKNFINYNSMRFTSFFGEPALKTLKKGDIIQIQRKGFYIVDSAYAEKSEFSGVELPLVLIAIPDGHVKEAPTTTTAGSLSAKGKQATVVSTPAATTGGGDAASLHADIEAQGSLVRDLKTKDAKSEATKAAITKLLDLKKQYKEKTGQEWKPGQPPAAAATASAAPSTGGGDLYKQVEDQGNLVRDLKAKDAKSDATKAAITKLLELKKQYKDATGQEWKPGQNPATAQPPATSAGVGGAADLNKQIEDQGNLVRDLKSKDAKSPETKAAIEKLLSLKKQYKDSTGQEWKPGPALTATAAQPAANSQNSAAAGDADLYKQIEDQGNLVRELKSKDAKSAETKAAIEKLLELKKQYKVGQEWKPGQTPVAVTQPVVPAQPVTGGSDLETQIVAQGDLVRQLKSKDAKSPETKAAIEKLLELKKQYKNATGKDYAPPIGGQQKDIKDKKREPAKAEPKVDAVAEKDGTKKVTKLGIETAKEDNYSEWYSQVITKAELIEYYDVSGCYVLRPWSYAIWEHIKAWFDKKIKLLGVKNCYFPMFVSQSALEREKTHIADFAPEVAWVTRAGSTELAEPIAIRPTSETVMYPSYKKWVHSHRDLPIRLNQWCNVVRWEFKHPTPFLRTREFLWQEGHTAFANPEDAQKEVFQILDLYEGVYQHLLAVPVIKGRKSEKEKFAGGDFTTTVEAYVPVNGRGVQGATSHHLGQNFSKMFDIAFENPDGDGRVFAWQNSWGLTTRTIGTMVMIHGDNKGLVLPPRVASIQVIVMPVGITAQSTEADRQKLVNTAHDIVEKLSSSGIRADSDLRDNYSPGWKFNHWELKGVPVRLEVGPKDLSKGEVTAVIRYSGEKRAWKLEGLADTASKTLEAIHDAMFQKVVKARDEHMKIVNDFAEFKKLLDEKFILLAPFCGRPECEENVKRDSQREDGGEGAQMGAKTLCYPLEQPKQPLPTKCFHPDCKEKSIVYALFGRSY